MIETGESIWDALTSPISTAITAATTTVLGAINRFDFQLPYLHEILGDISMFVGIIACIALIRVHVLRGDLMAMQKRDRGRRASDQDFMD